MQKIIQYVFIGIVVLVALFYFIKMVKDALPSKKKFDNQSENQSLSKGNSSNKKG